MARARSFADQLPIPVALSGVMFGVMMTPKGVCSGNPPANGVPPGAVWQATQSPAVTRALPRAIST